MGRGYQQVPVTPIKILTFEHQQLNVDINLIRTRIEVTCP